MAQSAPRGLESRVRSGLTSLRMNTGLPRTVSFLWTGVCQRHSTTAGTQTGRGCPGVIPPSPGQDGTSAIFLYVSKMYLYD